MGIYLYNPDAESFSKHVHTEVYDCAAVLVAVMLYF